MPCTPRSGLRQSVLLVVFSMFLIPAGAMAQAGTPEAVREHIEQADALVDTLLQRQHVITATGVDAGGAPTNARNTLIAIDRSAVTRVARLLDAILAMVPAHAHRSAGRAGDVRAHAEKARKIVRELLPATTATPSHQDALTTIDRTALMRLDIEMDAMDELTDVS